MIITVTLNTAIDRTLSVPAFRLGDAIEADLCRIQPAGKGINISRCLACLGIRSVATGFVGRGEKQLYCDSFDPELTEIDMVTIADATRTNITIRTSASDEDTHLRERGPNISRQDWARFLALLENRVNDGDIVVFSGSLPPGLDEEDLATAIRIASQSGARIAVDTQGPPLLRALREKPWLIKPNRKELSEILGLADCTSRNMLNLIEPLLDTVEMVVVSLDKEGIVMATRHGTWYAVSPVPCISNTVGPGDACLAGILVGQGQDNTVDETLRLAVGCGSASVLAEAAGILDPQLVERYSTAANVTALK